jgi:hypothetical protein
MMNKYTDYQQELDAAMSHLVVDSNVAFDMYEQAREAFRRTKGIERGVVLPGPFWFTASGRVLLTAAKATIGGEWAVYAREMDGAPAGPRDPMLERVADHGWKVSSIAGRLLFPWVEGRYRP